MPLRPLRRLSFGLIAVLLIASNAVAADWAFRVTFREELRAEPFTGRVYVFFSQTRAEPRTGPGWFEPEVFVSKDVTNWKPGEPLVLKAGDPELLSFPKPLSEVDVSGYRAQAVARFEPHERNVGTGAGNGFSDVVTISDPRADAVDASFTIDQRVPERTFRESRWSKPLVVRSELLSDFHGRDVFLRAGVILPASYHEHPDRRYPTIYTIPGFGGTYFDAETDRPVSESNERGVEFLRVILDPSTARGHHVFADSANNGPWGTALVEELIPAFEERFRAIAEPGARFLTGHSSGGWSSLWLQIKHPEFFGGTWSTGPDPVDFRDFQDIDLYRPGENVYVDREGDPRPLARVNGRVRLWYRDFDHMETVLGHGGQLHSFEAVFSPRGEDGEPRPAWDRETGAVDTEVTEHWKKYDIRLVLEENWDELGPKLDGKLHVIMGAEDNFYLEGATELLQEALADLPGEHTVELVPGRDHFNLLTPGFRERLRTEIAETFLERYSDWPND